MSKKMPLYDPIWQMTIDEHNRDGFAIVLGMDVGHVSFERSECVAHSFDTVRLDAGDHGRRSRRRPVRRPVTVLGHEGD
jgi:hypothetical protein